MSTSPRTPEIYEEDGPGDYPGVPFEKETDVMEKHHNEFKPFTATKIDSTSVDQSIRTTAMTIASANAKEGDSIATLLKNAKAVEFYLRGSDGSTVQEAP